MFFFQFQKYQLAKESENPILNLDELSDLTVENLDLRINLKNGNSYLVKFIRLDYLEKIVKDLLKNPKLTN